MKTKPLHHTGAQRLISMSPAQVAAQVTGEQTTRPQGTGSRVISILPGAGTKYAFVDVVGYGITVLTGAFSSIREGGAAPDIEMLAIAGGGDLSGSENRFIANAEVYEGANLAGHFNGLLVIWPTENVTTPLRLRIYDRSSRVFPMQDSGPIQGTGRILEFFDGQATTIPNGEANAVTLYDDNDTSWDGVSAPTWGMGLGSDTALGEHATLKRRLIGFIACTSLAEAFKFKVSIAAYPQASDSPSTLMVFASNPRVGAGASPDDLDTHVVSFGSHGNTVDDQAGVSQQGILLPGKIRIRVEATTGTGQTHYAWLAFAGV